VIVAVLESPAAGTQIGPLIGPITLHVQNLAGSEPVHRHGHARPVARRLRLHDGEYREAGVPDG